MIETSLRHALENNEFELHYQPLIELATEKIIGVEALLRWQHPKLGLTPPQEFIPIAQETGLLLTIGDWVLSTACTQAKAWQKQGFFIRMAVNFTSKQLLQTNAVAKIAKILEQNDLEPKVLELEITESTILEGTDQVIRVLQELQNIGISLVIDDFGTGYSSLSYLTQLPIDKLKIDRSFINFISQNPRDVSVILAIIAMTKSLGIRSLGEGVETKEQLEFLRQNGCDEIQGYYVSRPETSEKIIHLLKEKLQL